MRYKVYPSDTKKFYVLDTSSNTIVLYVSNRHIATRVCDDFNNTHEDESNSTKKH